MSRRAMRQAWIVFRKELTDSMRDRRALFSVAFGVLFGPLMIVLVMNRAADRQREAEDVRIPIVGAEHAPALVDWLRQQQGVEIASGPADPEQAVRDEDEDLVLVLPKEFAERFRLSRPAPVQFVADTSRDDARPTIERVRRLLQRYNAEIGSLRLIGRGVSPSAINPLELREIEVSTAQQRAAQLLGFVPTFLLIAGFIGSMQIATDSTAGERERGSLEPLLVNPAPRGAIVAGKWLAAAFVGMACVVLATVLWIYLTRVMPLEDMGIRFALGPRQVGGILAATLPLCLLTAALQGCVATLARSFKEAQSYMGVLVLVPMVPGMLNAMYPLGNQMWMYAVPVLGPLTLLTNVLSGRPPHAGAFLVAAVVSAASALILVRVMASLFRSERIIFAR